MRPFWGGCQPSREGFKAEQEKLYCTTLCHRGTFLHGKRHHLEVHNKWQKVKGWWKRKMYLNKFIFFQHSPEEWWQKTKRLIGNVEGFFRCDHGGQQSSLPWSHFITDIKRKCPSPCSAKIYHTGFIRYNYLLFVEVKRKGISWS